MDKTESVLWAVVAARSDDDAPKLVLAKWLDDRSDPRGACLRWVVAENKRPAFDRHDTKTWDWWSRTPADPMHYEISPCEYIVPMNLFSRLAPFGPGLWKSEATYLAALQNLSRLGANAFATRSMRRR